jgi:hypothetical protein
VSSDNNDSELAEGDNGEEERVEGLAKILRIGIELPNHFTKKTFLIREPTTHTIFFSSKK